MAGLVPRDRACHSTLIWRLILCISGPWLTRGDISTSKQRRKSLRGLNLSRDTVTVGRHSPTPTKHGSVLPGVTMKRHLTDAAVQRLRPPCRDSIEVFDLGYPGLALRIGNGGAKEFRAVLPPRRQAPAADAGAMAGGLFRCGARAVA